jgi:hypothetical protein
MMKLTPLLLLLLTAGVVPGCDPKGAVPPGVVLPHAPAHYAGCFKQLTTIPISSLTREKVVLLVAELRKSELAKSRCGRDLLDWYGRVRVAYGPKK